VAGGKGFYGRMTKAVVGAEDFGRIQGAVGALNTGLDVQAMVAMVMPTVPTIVSKVRIPRAGEAVRLIADPRQPGAYLYAGVGDA
jgi:hypothetical protein